MRLCEDEYSYEIMDPETGRFYVVDCCPIGNNNRIGSGRKAKSIEDDDVYDLYILGTPMWLIRDKLGVSWQSLNGAFDRLGISRPGRGNWKK